MAKTNNMNIESRFEEIKRLIFNPAVNRTSLLSLDGLLDAFVVLYDECCAPTITTEKPIKEFLHYGKFWRKIFQNWSFVFLAKQVISHVKNSRLTRNDFETIKTIGRGAFGEGQIGFLAWWKYLLENVRLVVVVKMKNTERVFAMKILNKSEILKRTDTACFREERDVLVSGDHQWITKLYYTFQDTENLVRWNCQLRKNACWILVFSTGILLWWWSAHFIVEI